ncbi:MAG: tyrosine-type recombinase/integrase [[Pasteurella] mairii]|uniref:Site-specific recombinase XerD n=1 Tax=[Pasteurella] mairii TaxID=757 RepID=A0A379B3G3_9PAST|nr:tyrosine-type recombinase/integrase [[Pasteurella] mairii]SUB33031.1 Site-specific recombinase XerD [[Pasteurella] mairii]
MGRHREHYNQNLPTHVYCRNRKHKRTGKEIFYYFYRLPNGKEISLGKDYNEALIKCARLNLDREKENKIITFTLVAKRYTEEVIPTKALHTQKSNISSLNILHKFFSDPPAPLSEIEPEHIRQFLDWKRSAPTMANKAISLFNTIWNKAREWEYTKDLSPVYGVKKHKQKNRTNYVENFVLEKVMEFADQNLKDLMEVAYLTGQRPIDVVKIHKNHIYDGVLHFTQQKTNAKVRMAISGRLAEILIPRLETTTNWLFHNKRGGKLSPNLLGYWFRNARKKAINKYPELENELLNFQFRDLRAKAGTDTALNKGIETARQQLGHTSLQMTRVYVRRDKVVSPTE